MELNELKHIWQSMSEEQPPAPRVEVEGLHAMVRARSRSIQQEINRRIWGEWSVLALIMLVLLSFVYLNDAPLLTGEAWVLGSLFIAATAFYAYKYRMINRHSLAHPSLKEGLEALSHTLWRFLQLYKILVYGILPALGGLFFIYGVYRGVLVKGGSMSGILGWQWGLLLGVMLVYVLLMGLGARWYTHNLYGKLYQHLQRCLAELEATPTN